MVFIWEDGRICENKTDGLLRNKNIEHEKKQAHHDKTYF
jgi:hypothetical protein